MTKADFRIVERGRAQEIADFEYVSIPVASPTIDLTAPVPPASDIATNTASARESRAIAIVVDDTVLSTDDIIWIKRVLAAMLATFTPDDHVALTYVRRSDLGQDFTNDAARHARAVNRLAIATGGRRYRQAEPWLSPARLMAENGSYYLLGYYPSPLRDDGTFQEVDVRVTRPGAQVRARKGYTVPGSRAPTLSPHRAMTTSLGAGLPDPGLP